MTVQTTYSRDLSAVSPGQPVGHGQNEGLLNTQGADIRAGIAVKLASEGKATLLGAATDAIAGISLLSYAKDPNDLSNSDAIKSAAVFDARIEGKVMVYVDQTVAVGDPVYVRFAANGGSTVLGAFRKDSDTSYARLVKGARYTKGASSGGAAEIYFSAAAESALGDLVEFVIPNASVSATTTAISLKTRADRVLKIESVFYVNETGLAADATNYFALALKNGSTSLATWSTLSTADGAIGASAAVTMTLSSTATDLVLAPGTTLKTVLTKSGTQTLPVGAFIVHGRYI